MTRQLWEKWPPLRRVCMCVCVCVSGWEHAHLKGCAALNGNDAALHPAPPSAKRWALPPYWHWYLPVSSTASVQTPHSGPLSTSHFLRAALRTVTSVCVAHLPFWPLAYVAACTIGMHLDAVGWHLKISDTDPFASLHWLFMQVIKSLFYRICHNALLF